MRDWGVDMTLDYIIKGIITIVLAVLGFFLRRTMTDLDGVQKTVEDIKLNYTPRTDFEKLDRKIDKVTETMHEVQLNSVSKSDFFIKMSEIASTLERMEDKMERYRNGK